MMPLDSSSVRRRRAGRAGREDRRVEPARRPPRSPVSHVVRDDAREVVVGPRVLLDEEVPAAVDARRCRACSASPRRASGSAVEQQRQRPAELRVLDVLVAAARQTPPPSATARRRRRSARPRSSRSRSVRAARVERAVLDAVEREAVGDRLLVLALARGVPVDLLELHVRRRADADGRAEVARRSSRRLSLASSTKLVPFVRPARERVTLASTSRRRTTQSWLRSPGRPPCRGRASGRCAVSAASVFSQEKRPRRGSCLASPSSVTPKSRPRRRPPRWRSRSGRRSRDRCAGCRAGPDRSASSSRSGRTARTAPGRCPRGCAG